MTTSASFTPRPKQQLVLDYSGGTMGVAAVPGSGKTWTLSLLAADLIARGALNQDQEILIVTLVNSAVNNFAQRVGDFVTDRGYLPSIGYRVRTLHGLAHDIVRERPSLVNLGENFDIIDERAAESILTDVTQAWLRGHPYDLDAYLKSDLEENEDRRNWVRQEQFPRMVQGLASNFIRYAKDLELSPERLRSRLDQVPVPLPLAEMGCEIYENYDSALAYRGAVDFSDLIRLALEALQADAGFLERLRYRWPYILEDESQDSSRLQEQILRTLAGENGNWVRVGDPNQAIFETFTTADPQYLKDFISTADFPRDLPNSGRSTPRLIELANYLIDWTNQEHPVAAVRNALSKPHIQPTPLGDPQPNPPDEKSFIFLGREGYSPDREIQMVANSLAKWLPDHSNTTVAVLVPRNVRGFQLANALRDRGIEPLDSLLRSSDKTRRTAGALTNILRYLEDPKSARLLATAYRVWRRSEREDESAAALIERGTVLLRNCQNVEDYLWPRSEANWLETQFLQEEEPEIYEDLLVFRQVVRRWQETILLPVDQIILTLGQDIFTEPTELALTHKLAVVLSRAMENNLDWRLPEFTQELAVVAKNERRFLGFSEEDRGFDPEKHKGQVVIATVHKAKGLEWDRVYMMSVNNYDFPSGMAYDSYISEKWFLRDGLNLEAETLAQLDAVLSADPYEWYEEGAATEAARMEYVSERLRLLFVGITRAKKELVVTWNTGRRGDSQAAIPLVALQTYIEERDLGATG
jgi:DNA helicase-2/ATP-dependent DNA helicase PcrA